jgi:hypothetical protein
MIRLCGHGVPANAQVWHAPNSKAMEAERVQHERQPPLNHRLGRRHEWRMQTRLKNTDKHAIIMPSALDQERV